MYIKGDEVTFENGLSVNFKDTIDSLKSKIKKERELKIANEYSYISFDSDEMIKDYEEHTAFFFDIEGEHQLYEIEIEFNSHSYAGRNFESYQEFADCNKKFFNELRDYLLEQFGNEKVVGNSDHGFTIKDDDLVLGLNTGRGFEHVKINILSADNPLLEE